MAMCSWARWATSRSAPAAACWKRTRASANWRAWNRFIAASNAANCVRARAERGAAAWGARLGFLVVRGAFGFVMRLSAIRESVALLFLSAMSTQHGYIRPRHQDATGMWLAIRVRPP